jgi:hypothetical protein
MHRESIVILLLLTIAAFLPSLASTWTSDDYALVYGIFGNPVLSFTEALARSHQGAITAHRLLTYWFIGTGGIFGPPVAHGLALVIHFLCAWLFGVLVWRLFGSPMVAFLASAWFAPAPWISQPVLWWSAICTILSTICLLTAAHFFLRSFSTRWSIVMAWLSTFAGLCFYDLWIAGFLLFVGIGLVVHQNANELQRAAVWRRRVLHIAAMAIPFLLWFGLVGIIGPRTGAEEKVAFSLERLPVVFASIHLRVANWFIGPDWLALWRMGIDAWADPLSAFSFVVSFGLLILIFARFATKSNPSVAPNGTSDPLIANNQSRKELSSARFPWPVLFCAWMIFLASRLAIVLQGGTALHSRLNYGAATAVALAAAALASWTWHRWCKRSSLLRWSSVVGAIASIALMTLATSGRARHMALSSTAEAYTITMLDQELSKHPEIRSVTIIGTPVPDIGELGYFSEENGLWLRAVLRNIGHAVDVRVIRHKDVGGTHSDSEVYFHWSGNWPGARIERVLH